MVGGVFRVPSSPIIRRSVAELISPANLDEISDLQDSDLFCDKIRAQVNARKPRTSEKNPPDPFKNPTQVALTVTTR